MLPTRQVQYHDNFSFDVQEETGRRVVADDGTPLAEPEDVLLHTVVFTGQDAFGTVQERRYRFLPATWETMREKVNGGVALATLLDMPPGVERPGSGPAEAAG